MAPLTTVARLLSKPNALGRLSIGARYHAIRGRHVYHSTSTTSSNVKTQFISPAEGDKILIAQRRNRPNAPHLSIYKMQLTSINSSLERITGIMLGGSVYLFGIAYLVSPYLGWNLSSSALAAGMAGLPWMGKLALKFGAAWPFFFHGFNSLRHLGWDMTKGFQMATVYRTGYAAAGLSVITAVGFAIWF